MPKGHYLITHEKMFFFVCKYVVALFVGALELLTESKNLSFFARYKEYSLYYQGQKNIFFQQN